jgi:hypothetical protein
MEENMKSHWFAFPVVVLGSALLFAACTVSGSGSLGVSTCQSDIGDPCQQDSDCCDAYCDDGACSACVSSGNDCGSDDECCSNVCLDDGSCN